MENAPLISVVIITYNEEKNIENCLKSVFSSSFRNMEVLVVDGGSTDDTGPIVKEKFPQVKFSISPVKGMTHQRNYGFKNSLGKYILYLDADMTISPGLITECVGIYAKNDQLVGIYVPEIIFGNSLLSKIRKFERSFYNGTVLDAVRFFVNARAKEIGYFDEKIREACEDWDFDKRLRREGETTISKNVLWHNEAYLNLKSYLKKKKKYLNTIDDYLNKWGKNDPDTKKQFGLYYRYWYVFIENGKWRKTIRHPIKFIGVIFLKSLTGINFLIHKVKKLKYD